MKKILMALLCATVVFVCVPTAFALTPTNDDIVFEDEEGTDISDPADKQDEANTETADPTKQTYELTALADGTVVFTPKSPAAFWEAPTLKTGEFYTKSGQLIFHNRTKTSQEIQLQAVAFPYENEEALRYLNHLHLTVMSGHTVLYEGPYSRINDDTSFNLKTTLESGTWVGYTIRLRCDYNYTGSGLGAQDVIRWEFSSVTPTAADDQVHFDDQALLEVVLACGIAVIVLAAIFLYDRFWRARR